MQQVRAKYFSANPGKDVICHLCPHECTIKAGKAGICKVRRNDDGVLYSDNYGLAVGIGIDPIEKKPLYHFHPGKKIFSIGTPGCNMKCFYCQNCNMSQVGAENYTDYRVYLPEDLLKVAENSKNNLGIAFTYNEPTVYYEYMLDTAKIFKKNGFKTIMVSNGFINPEPLEEILALMDAFNIDLKSFDNNFYKKYTGSSLSPVLESIASISQSGKHLEITFLLIPGLNDDKKLFRNMLDWIVQNCSKDCVLHISRYFPHYKSKISSTPLDLLDDFYKIAKEHLNYVYLGNVPGTKTNSTFCPSCGKLCVSRNNYFIENFLSLEGNCPECGKSILQN